MSGGRWFDEPEPLIWWIDLEASNPDRANREAVPADILARFGYEQRWTRFDGHMATREAARANLHLYAGTRRSELVAACWHAGERNIRELARLAKVERQTIYTDLETEGIDWRDRTAVMHQPTYRQVKGPAPEGALSSFECQWCHDVYVLDEDTIHPYTPGTEIVAFDEATRAHHESHCGKNPEVQKRRDELWAKVEKAAAARTGWIATTPQEARKMLETAEAVAQARRARGETSQPGILVVKDQPGSERETST